MRCLLAELRVVSIFYTFECSPYFLVIVFHLCYFIFLDIRAEMMPDTLPDRSEVAKFDQSKLKHVKTQQKEVLPTKSGVLKARICCGHIKRCSVRGILHIHVLSAMRTCQQDAQTLCA